LRDRDTDDDGTLDETLHYTNDANMNVTALVNDSGTVVERYVYDPYGKVTFMDGSWNEITWANSKQNHILYCGYYYDDETGLYSVRNRTLHPTLGRWTSRDPIGYQYCASLYCYGESMPTRMLDPSGTWCGECAPPGVGYPNVYNVRTRFQVTSRKADPDTIDWDTALTGLTVIKVAAAVKDLGGGAAGGLAKGAAAVGLAKGAVSRGFKTGKSSGLQDACLEGVEDIKESAKGPTASNLGLALWVLLKYESCDPCCPVMYPFQWGGAQDHEWVEHEAKYHCIGFGDYPGDTEAYKSEESAAKDEAKCAKLAEQALREGRL